MGTQNGCLKKLLEFSCPLEGQLVFFVGVLGLWFCVLGFSHAAYGQISATTVEMESTLWSRMITSQGSYPSRSKGVRFGGDHFFRYQSRNWSLGGRAHLEDVSYMIDSTQRRGLGVGLGGIGSMIYRFQENLSVHFILYLEPWRQMTVGSRERATINADNVESSSLAIYSNGYGFESGVGLYRGVELVIKNMSYPLMVGVGMNLRLLNYGKIRTKTALSVESGPRTIAQNVLTQYRSLVGVLMLDVLIK
jgi:hypothetical protein